MYNSAYTPNIDLYSFDDSLNFKLGFDANSRELPPNSGAASNGMQQRFSSNEVHCVRWDGSRFYHKTIFTLK